MHLPKVSIVTVTYNSESYLRTCIESVINQSYPKIEFIIVDGNSKDNSVQIVRSYGDKIQKFVSEPDKGIYDAMNKGVGMATGDIVGILNSDDLYLNDSVVEKIVQLFDSSTDALYGDLVYTQQDDISKIVRYWKSGSFSPGKMKRGWMPPHPTFFVRRELYDKYGKFSLNLRSSADYELMLRFLLKHKIRVKYLPEVLVKMRAGGQSNSSIKNRLKANKEDREAWRMNGLKPQFYTFLLKPIRKIGQFFVFGRGNG